VSSAEGLQAVLPGGAKVPTGQEVQAVLPEADAKVPTGQEVQGSMPLAEKVPGAQDCADADPAYKKAHKKKVKNNCITKRSLFVPSALLRYSVAVFRS
jgi:hypothetical protein